MNKTAKSVLCILLLMALLAAIILPVFAEEAEEAPEEGTELHIRTVDDFLGFAENCIRDIYSQDMTVYLDADLDLTDTAFSGIPIFCGILEGKNHTIRGLCLTGEGSVTGLFRYLTKSAVVKDLIVLGEVLPTGSRQSVGGIAGSNAGTIQNCRFHGEVSGSDSVGGMVGVNQVSGIVEDCQVFGHICGSHFAGGVVGENYGLIRRCKNKAGINTHEEDNQIQSVNFSPDIVLGKEAAATVTDLGGIVGTTTGVVRGCKNSGDVGYPHMGYNVGGIAGSQKGYITECENSGSIHGRKEVAGIAGQQEPVVKISYTADTLQILRGQLATTSALADRASSNIHSTAQDLSEDLYDLYDQADIAMDAVEELLPSAEEPHFPDYDTVIAAKNTLSSTVGSMQNTIGSINHSAQAGISTAAGDIRAITNQINAISRTLDTAADNLGGTITDISDQDTEEDLNGKISLCQNVGEVSGDLNVGGIVGAIAWENDKDPEDDLDVTGERSLNFDSQLRAVILDSQNRGPITTKKRHAGGIVGIGTLGLVKGCLNTGLLDAEGADYIGGIVGRGNGYIRQSNAKCKIIGNSFLGGIAGKAPIVTDCRSMVLVEDGAEKIGSILGIAADNRAEIENPIANNFYLPLSNHLGAIDGIDYYGVADSLTRAEFLALEDIPEIFMKATLTFVNPEGETKSLMVPLGRKVSKAQIPVLPPKNGYIAQWEHLDEIDLSNVFLDLTLEAEYIPCFTVIQSSQSRENGKPVLLVEGQFSDDENMDLVTAQVVPDLPNGYEAVEVWQLPKLKDDEEHLVHLAIPENLKSTNARIVIQHSDDSWEEIPAEDDGSYLVFSMASGDKSVCMAKAPSIQTSEILILCAGAAVLVAAVTILLVKKHKKRKKKA